eukprot:6956493-Pyramimonas_sp.AAC.1
MPGKQKSTSLAETLMPAKAECDFERGHTFEKTHKSFSRLRLPCSSARTHFRKTSECLGEP